MTGLQKTRALVLGRRPLKESDAIASVLTEEGQALELCIYGIQKSRKRSAFLWEPGTLIDIDFYTRGDAMASLKEGHVCERFSALKEGYSAITLLSYFLELSALAARCGSSPMLFLLVKGSLNELCFGKDRKPKIQEELEKLHVLIFFQIRLLSLLGLLGLEERCSECGKGLGEEARWNLPEGHFSCKTCKPEGNMEEGSMAQILALAKSKIFRKYREEAEKKGLGRNRIFLLTLWKNLNLCIENFAAKPFLSSKELEKQLRLSSSLEEK